MNLKKTALSLFAATAIMSSMVVPAFAADDSREVSGTAEDNGSITFGFSQVHPVTFQIAVVNTADAADVQSNAHGFTVTDTYSYSPGWNLQITVEDLQTTFNQTTYTIDNANMSVSSRQKASVNQCTNENLNMPVNGGNGFQDISMVPHVETGSIPLSGPVNAVTATSGRGCGYMQEMGTRYFLHVPEGTFTNSTQAVFTSNIVLTNTVTPPAPPAS